jgi:phosphoglucosamine mutase
MSNMGLDNAVRAAGGRVLRTQVGDRYVVEAMREGGYIVGGEQSGHLIFLDHASTGDGIVAALQIQAIMVREQRPLSELASEVMERVPQVLVNSEVARKVPLETLPDVQKLIRKVEKALGDDGRVLVRYSGTENKVRVLVEGPDEAASRRHAAEISDALVKALGR